MNKKPRVIGLYGDSFQEIVQRPVSGVLRYCEEWGEFVVRDFRMRELEDTRRPPSWKGRVDGVVLSTGRADELSDEAMADWTLSGGAAAVSVTADWIDPRIPAFHVDRPSLARLAARHLVECECRSFLFVGFALSTGSALRGQALREALAERGQKLVECATQSYFSGSFEDESTVTKEKKLIEHLERLRKPIGVWALNDNFAHAVCLLCEKLELDIPKSVKVLGVDDTSVARLSRPAISSIRTPGEEIGYQAMRALHKLLDGRRGLAKITPVPATDVVVRESTMQTSAALGDLQAALEYIAQHACTGVTIEQLVEITGMSRRSFEERFRREFGRSPGQEIQRVRLERAKNLLGDTQLSISRIASMVGFEETAAFSKFFQNQAGTSPRSFREDNHDR